MDNENNLYKYEFSMLPLYADELQKKLENTLTTLTNLKKPRAILFPFFFSSKAKEQIKFYQSENIDNQKFLSLMKRLRTQVSTDEQLQLIERVEKCCNQLQTINLEIIKRTRSRITTIFHEVLEFIVNVLLNKLFHFFY